MFGIHTGTGLQDFLDPGPILAISLQRGAADTAAGLAVRNHDLPDIHSWDVWRQKPQRLRAYDGVPGHHDAGFGRAGACGLVDDVVGVGRRGLDPRDQTWRQGHLYADGEAATGRLLGPRVRTDGTAALRATSAPGYRRLISP